MRAMQQSQSLPLSSFTPARLWLLGALLTSIGALATALMGEFAFDLEPCILCLYQRIPYVAVAVIAGLGIVLPLTERQRRRLLGLVGLVFALGAGLGVYHVGIEQHWWTSSIPGCVGAPVRPMSVDDLREGILVPLRSCDQVDWRLFGLSLAGWNTVASAILAAACLVLVVRLQERRNR
jgi:disulfide bond formation protein DsbB